MTNYELSGLILAIGIVSFLLVSQVSGEKTRRVMQQLIKGIRYYKSQKPNNSVDSKQGLVSGVDSQKCHRNKPNSNQ